MKNKVILAGASGDLGTRVVQALRNKGAEVRCLIRPSTSAGKKSALLARGAQLREVNFDHPSELARACEGGSVVVSTVSGLEDVIIGFQSKLLAATVAAGVPRFIPSDFAVDYRMIPAGENRNLNLRERFREVVDRTTAVRATSVLNGAFTDMLTGVAPFILYPIRRILCWGDPDQLMDWTTIDDTAEYTAHVALDPSSPRYLTIAGDELSARRLAAIMGDITGERFGILRPGGPELLKRMIGVTKVFVPGTGKVYPPWQGMQYMHSMYVGRCKFRRLDNARYPVEFTAARMLLAEYLAGKIRKYVPGG